MYSTKEESAMKLENIIAKVKEVIHGSAGVNLSIGNPSQIGDLSVIPVARVVLGFGGGGGSSAGKKQKQKQDQTDANEPDKEAEDNFGGGGGGSVKTEPVGIYLIKGDKARFYPVISIREIIAIFSILSLLLLKIHKLRRKR
jgi:uncharacterized spore protein YtfJ